MAIGSPLDPILKNIFMRDFKEKWARTSKNRPSGWFRYVDDIFALFDDKKSVSIFTISQQSPQRHKIHYRILRERRNCFFRYSCKTLRWQRFHDFGIRDLTKIPCGNRENDKYIDGIRDLTVPREAGLANNWARDTGFMFVCLSGIRQPTGSNGSVLWQR